MIFVLLPLLNSDGPIAEAIDSIRSHLKPYDYKIIVVRGPDCAADDRVLSGGDMIVYSQALDLGMGAILSTGILAALKISQSVEDILLTMEVGFAKDAALWRALIRAMDKGQDVVIASRYAQGHRGYVHFPGIRFFFSLGVNRLMRTLFPVEQISDYTIFLRAYRVGVLQEAIKYFGKFGLIQARGFVSNTELLVKLSFLTRRMSEIPFLYDFRYCGFRSKIKIWETINEYIVVIGYLRRIRRKITGYQNRLRSILGGKTPGFQAGDGAFSRQEGSKAPRALAQGVPQNLSKGEELI